MVKRKAIKFIGIGVAGITFFGLALIGLNSCQKDDVKAKSLPTVTTAAIASIATSSASGGGAVSSDGGAPITARGIVWDMKAVPSISLPSKTSDGTGTGSFTSSLSGLTGATRYFVRAYASNSAGTTYGDEVSFITLANLPTVTTIVATNITAVTASSGGSITNDGGSPIAARGIVWDTKTNPTISLSTKTSDGTGAGDFTSNLNALTAATKYFVRAYATNGTGTAYGNELTFSTLANLPTLATTPVNNIMSGSASSGGNISLDGGAAVTERGIVWDTKIGPTVSLSTKTSEGTGSGIYTSNLTGLSAATTYYVRAYATNSAGTGYGSEQSFTTTPLQTHDFNKTEIPVGGNGYADNGAAITTDGLTNWINPATVCKTFFRLSQAGTLKVSLKINATNGNNLIKVTAQGKSFQLPITGNSSTEVFVGQWDVASQGYISIDVQGISKTSTSFGVLSTVYVSGSAVTNSMTFIPNNNNSMFYWGRRGTALSLSHDVSGISDIEYYYSEVKVPSGSDAIGSYYMANGFGEGYFGMQVVSPTERWILFSVWSPFVTDNPANIPPEDQVILARKGTNVITGSFGNEGSGGKSYLVYNWKADNTYRFLVQGKPIANNFTQYTAWFYAPDESKWFLIASWNRPKTNTYLKSLYSFIENFQPETGITTRMAYYGNQWVKPSGGSWRELTKATVSGSPESAYRKDYAGGILNGTYYLKISGFFNDFTTLNQSYQRPSVGTPPTTDLSTLP